MLCYPAWMMITTVSGWNSSLQLPPVTSFRPRLHPFRNHGTALQLGGYHLGLKAWTSGSRKSWTLPCPRPARGKNYPSNTGGRPKIVAYPRAQLSSPRRTFWLILLTRQGCCRRLLHEQVSPSLLLVQVLFLEVPDRRTSNKKEGVPPRLGKNKKAKSAAPESSPEVVAMSPPPEPA
nr:uncharacterized protein LOC117275976 [Nicotiana tomentosiformis]